MKDSISGYKHGRAEPPRYSVLREDLEDKTLRMLKLVRAALIYLSLAVHREETLHSKRNPKGSGLIAQMSMGIWDDDWKR